MNVYCISGFGADERIFQHLNFGNYTPVHIPWVIPTKDETLTGYAKKMASVIEQEDSVIIGVSFGGMMAIEISKLITLKKIILISSVKSRIELPKYMRIAGKLKLDKIIPLKPYSFLSNIENYNLGVLNEEEKQLAEAYRKNLNPAYSQWAIHQIINWQNTLIPKNTIHIHGSADRIFPIRYLNADYVVKGGGHLMVMNKPDEISRILQIEL